MNSYETSPQTPAKITEIDKRAFGLETIPYDGCTVTLLSLEYDYAQDERITPPDWQEQVSQAIQNADLTFVEYFTPELEHTIPSYQKLTAYAQKIADVYGAIANIAHTQGKDVAVADIANKPLYEAYNLGTIPALGIVAIAGARRGGVLGYAGLLASEAYLASMAYQVSRKQGTFAVQPSKIERYTPNLTDARRALTTQGIAQAARQYPEGSSLLYVAAPAHVTRVKAMLETPTTANRAKLAVYKRLVGLDRTTRIYRPRGKDWELLALHDFTDIR